jgi:HEAT repeat protein
VNPANQETLPTEEIVELGKVLNLAISAANSGNWSLVIQYLQQLPIATKKTSLASLNEEELNIANEIAFQVLLAGDFPEKWQVAYILPKLIKASINAKEAISRLIATIENRQTDLEVLWFVARILGEFDEPETILALVKLLEQAEDEDIAKVASEALAKIGTSAIDSLSKLLDEEHSRLLAARSLAVIRKPQIIEPLLKVVKDINPEVRLSAIEALSSFHDDRIDNILIDALTDTATPVRKEAAIALGMRAEKSDKLNSIELIKPLLYDLNPEVCRQAAIALGRIGNETAIEVLFSLLKSSLTPIWLQIDIVRALAWSESDRALDYLKEALTWTNETVSQEIVIVLGRQDLEHLKTKATQILIDYLHSEEAIASDTEIKKAISMSIGELGGSLGISSLNELATDTDTTVRLHAIAALKKLERKAS